MVELTPSQKGAAAEAAITSAIIRLGLTVLRPLCEGRRYDLIVDLEPRASAGAVQARAARGGRSRGPHRDVSLTPNGYIRKPYSPAEIDAIAAYSPELLRSFLIPMTAITARREISLRLKPTQNNQADGVRWAHDYELESVIQLLRAQQIQRGG
jgi:PD-(D/E)XK endonuclease